MSKLPFLLIPTLLASTSAFAMTCLNDYSGNGKGCANITEAAGDCTTLGYSLDDNPNCLRWLRCPFDPTYKRCVKQGDGCNETTEFAVCRTIDTCSGGSGLFVRNDNFKESGVWDINTGTWTSSDSTSSSSDSSSTHNPNCYTCKAGYEYAPNVSASKIIKLGSYASTSRAKEGDIYYNPPTESSDEMVTCRKEYSAVTCIGTMTLFEHVFVPGCQCIKRYGCPESEYPYTICPSLSVCSECSKGKYPCTDAYYKRTKCIVNAELVNGECQCKEGFIEVNNKCINQEQLCIERQAQYKKPKGRYYVSCIGGFGQCKHDGQYCKATSFYESDFMDGCLTWAYDIKMPTTSGEKPVPNFENCDLWVDQQYQCNREQVCTFRETCEDFAKLIKKKVDEHNAECPNHKVEMPSLVCDQYIPADSDAPDKYHHRGHQNSHGC